MCRFLIGAVVLVLPFLTFASVPARVGAEVPQTIVLQNNGSDWGARINAADAQLGPNSGTIVVEGGGHIATQVVIGSNHTLKFGPGTWTNSNINQTFLLKDHTRLEGHGWDTVIQEAPGNNPSSYFLVMPYGTARIDGAGQVQDITVSDIQFSGLGIQKAPNGAQSTVITGLLAGGAFRHLWFSRTHGIGLTIGETNLHGNVFAHNIMVSDCRFTNVGGGIPPKYIGGGGVGLAIINGKHITISHNTFVDAWGNADLDIEPNAPADDVTDISIVGNVFSQEWTTGQAEMEIYGVVAHGHGGHFGPVSIIGNEFRGTYYRNGSYPEWYPGGSMLVAIETNYGGVANTHDFVIMSNDIRYTGGAPIILTATDNSRVENNRIFMPNNNLIVVGSHNVVAHNYVATNATETVYYFGIEERGKSDENQFTNNQTVGVAFVNDKYMGSNWDRTKAVWIVGPHSVGRSNQVIPRPPFSTSTSR